MPLDNITELRKRVPGGKYALTRALAERARQLQNGAMPLAEVRTPNPLSVAIDEIVQGKVSFTVTADAEGVHSTAEQRAELAEAAEEAAKAAPAADSE